MGSHAYGEVLFVKSGTQLIDRFWKSLRAHMGTRHYKVGSPEMEARIRSAQWEYQHRGQDMWAATAHMLSGRWAYEAPVLNKWTVTLAGMMWFKRAGRKGDAMILSSGHSVETRPDLMTVGSTWVRGRHWSERP